jgi:signal transduction histidine kinase
MNSIIHAFSKSESGEIIISAFLENDKLHFSYKDNGKGLTDQDKEKIFDPFYTTNRANGGSGLGMNIVYNIITTKLGGSIDVVSKVGYGVEFKIVLDGCVQQSRSCEPLMA